MIKLYNTLSKRLQEVPQQDHINLYTCGPTVYNHAHIGNLRSFIMADLLYRSLVYDGYKVNWVMNVTDVDDKTIKNTIGEFGPQATVEDLKKFTNRYYEAFLKDLEEVNVSKDAIKFIKVTDVIPEIQEFIIKLLDKGYAYKAEDGSTYFSIEKYQKDFGDYGALVGEKFLEGKKVGARVAVDEYDKENLSDFALWKAHGADDAQIFWDHKVLGKGRPGWHIECSVINNFAFHGEPTDIHTGGVDLIFPHHTNEIAQSQALLGKGNFVRHWFHSEHLLVDGKKMAKSLNNFYVLQDLENVAALAPWSLRYLFLQSHYRTLENFSADSLVAASNGVVGFINSIKDGVDNSPLELKSLATDLNSAKALSENPPAVILEKLIGVDLHQIGKEEELPEKVEKLARERTQARKNKDFAESDKLRKQIENLGYEVMDTPEGQKIKKQMKL